MCWFLMRSIIAEAVHRFVCFPVLSLIHLLRLSHSEPQHQSTVTEAKDDLQSLHQQGTRSVQIHLFTIFQELSSV